MYVCECVFLCWWTLCLGFCLFACVTSGKRYIVHPLGTLPLLLWRCSCGICGRTF